MKLKLHFNLVLIAAILAGLAGGFLAVAPAAAAEILVDNNLDTRANDGSCTLREAIINANNNNQSGSTDCAIGSGADRIMFQFNNVITLNSALPDITDAAGLVIDGYGRVNISGNSLVQVFIVDAGASLTLEDLTIQYGHDAAEGGAIENHGLLTIDHSTFSFNTSAKGGAIFNWNDTDVSLTVTDSTFYSNTASIMGGGIQNYYGDLNVDSSTFTFNSAPNGGGIDTLGSSGNNLRVTNSSFISNSASSSGAGIFNYGPLIVTNSTFSDNHNPMYGGGIFNDGLTLTVINSTFSGNSVVSGGGIIHNHDGVATTVLKNTTVANSTGGSNCYGTLTNGGNNIDSSTSCGFGLTDGSMSSTDPILGTLTGNPAYFPLNSGSPAIDGVTWSNPNSCPASDQRGYGRAVDGDGNGTDLCDIGSYEYGATFVSTITRVSVKNGGAQANGDSQLPAVSSDGRYVAFESTASLVSGDTDGTTDVYLRDTVAGTSIPISVDQSDNPGGGMSPSISADGRYVAFMSMASLASADNNAYSDIYVRDTQLGTTTLISTDTSGTVGNFYSYQPSISADGLHVAFYSYATNLVGFDTNGKADVFLHNLDLAHITTLVSLRTDGLQGGNGNSTFPVISADGHYVAFHSVASDLVNQDTNAKGDIFIRDTVGNTTTLVSVSSSGAQANDWSNEGESISADGRYVAFWSNATNLVPGSDGFQNVYLRDTEAHTTILVSVDSNGNEGAGDSEYPSISANGRYVTFETGIRLVVGDTNGHLDIYLKDTQTGMVTLLSKDSYGVQANGDSGYASISADGSCAAFHSAASNLVNGDTNSAYDVFVAPIPSQPPADFNKISPVNGATGVAINPTLSWDTSSAASSYEYCYATTNGCTSWVSLGMNTSVDLSGLNHNQVYYWQVRAVNSGGNTFADTGTYWSFTTAVESSSSTIFLPMIRR